jgi:hypothetical protein
MTFTVLLVLTVIVLIAALAPILGVDSRDLGCGDGPRRDKLWSRED